MKNKTAYIWGLLGKLGPQLLYLCTTFVLARFLTPKDFGIIGILTIFISVSQTLLEAGLGGSLIKEESVTDNDYSTIFVFNIIGSALLYIIIFIGAPYIEDFYKIKGISTICRVLCLVFVINSWGQIAQTILFRNLRFKILMIVSIISVIAGSVASITSAVWLKWGVYSLVSYQLVHSVTYVILNWQYCKYTPSFYFSINSFKKLFSFGFYTTVIGIIESIYENLITSLFGKYMSVVQAGYLSQAKRIETASVNSLSGTVNSVSFPILTRLKGNLIEFKKESDSLLKNLSLLVLPIIFGIALFSDKIINILYGKEWIKAAPYLEILMWVGCAFVLETANRNFIKSLGNIKTLLKATVFKRIIAIIIIGLCILFNPQFILYGYFLGAVIGYLTNALCYTKIINYNFFKYIISTFKYIIPPLCCYLMCLIGKSFLLKNEYLYGILILVIYFIYYLIVLPFYGIRIAEFLNKKCNHENNH